MRSVYGVRDLLKDRIMKVADEVCRMKIMKKRRGGHTWWNDGVMAAITEKRGFCLILNERVRWEDGPRLREGYR